MLESNENLKKGPVIIVDICLKCCVKKENRTFKRIQSISVPNKFYYFPFSLKKFFYLSFNVIQKNNFSIIIIYLLKLKKQQKI